MIFASSSTALTYESIVNKSQSRSSKLYMLRNKNIDGGNRILKQFNSILHKYEKMSIELIKTY